MSGRLAYGSRLGEGLVSIKDITKALRITSKTFKEWNVDPEEVNGKVNWYTLSSIIENRKAEERNIMMRKSQKYADGQSKAAQDLRLAKQKADKLEIDNEVRRGNLVPLPLLRDILSEVAAEISSQMDTIPAQVKRKNPTLERQDMESIKSALVAVQNSIANLDRISDRKIDEYIAELSSKYEY